MPLLKALKLGLPALAVGGLLITAATGAVPMAQSFSGPEQTTDFTYQTATLTTGTVRKRVQTSGTVRPLVTVQVGSQLSGQIKKVFADFNSKVKANDILAVLDDETFRARVDQATADLATAEANLMSQHAMLQKVIANQREAERAHQRAMALTKKGITAKAMADTASRDADVAQAEIAITKAQIDVAQGTVMAKRAALRQAEIDLNRTTIRAPMDGTVISRTVEVGQTVAASLSAPELFRIAQDLRDIVIEAQVTESDIGGVAEGNPVSFRVDAYPDRPFAGEVSQIRPSGTEERGIVTYTVVIRATNADLKLHPAMTATVDIELAQRTNVARVPIEAMRYKPLDADKGTSQQKSERRMEKLAELTEILKLSDAQKQKATEALATLNRMEQAAASAQAQAPGESKPKLPSSTDLIETALVPTFTSSQAAAFENWKKGRSESRAVVLWVLNHSEKPEKRSVRIGLTDDKYAEIITRGDLSNDDRVILRSTMAGAQP